MKSLFYFKALLSPFKPFRLKFYFGKIAIGLPYFLPRRAVKDKSREGYTKFVPVKWFWFNSCSLGWKTKWTETDYRFEWQPVFSFVFLKKQFCIFVSAIEPDHYWSSWLYYEFSTDKTKSKKERIEQCRREFPQKWIVSKNGEKKNVDYYDVILKKKYLKK